jgi:hypothetical protein
MYYYGSWRVDAENREKARRLISTACGYDVDIKNILTKSELPKVIIPDDWSPKSI